MPTMKNVVFGTGKAIPAELIDKVDAVKLPFEAEGWESVENERFIEGGKKLVKEKVVEEKAEPKPKKKTTKKKTTKKKATKSTKEKK